MQDTQALALDSITRDITILSEETHHAPQIDGLVDHVFGPGRYVKTAERLREGSAPIAKYSFVAVQGDKVVGTVRLWPIFVWCEADNTRRPLVFLGPICVDPSLRTKGIGRSLVNAAVDAALSDGLEAVLLVGTPAYFKPFGFDVAQDIALPGPVDPSRLLIRYNDDVPPMNGLVVKVLNA